MIIGLISAFQGVFIREARIGRLVANIEFERALLTKSQARELHFFCPTSAACSRFQEVFADLIRARTGPVRVFTFLHLPTLLRSFDYTALHQADLISYYPAMAFVRNRLAPRVPLTMVTHTISYREIISENFKKLLPGPMPFDALIASSKTAGEVFRRNLYHLARGLAEIFTSKLSFPGQVVQIPLGVDTGVYQPGDRSKARASLGLAPGAFVALSLGRLNYLDKMDLLPVLRLWTEVVGSSGSERPILILAGSDEGGYAGLLQSQIKALNLEGKALVRPNPDHRTKSDLLAGADVFLSLADNVQETFGLSVIEAQAAGLPVLASDFDGYRDLVEDGCTGFLIPTAWAPDHPIATELSAVLLNNSSHLVQSQGTVISLSDLAARLVELKTNPGLRQKMARQARERMKKLFDWGVVIQAYEELWSKLKEQARNYSGPPGPTHDPFAFTWSDLFGHYPSSSLAGQEKLGLTAFGRDYLEHQERPVMYPDMTPLLSPDLLKRLATVLEFGPKSVAEVRAGVQGFDPSLVGYHLHWLLKNYLVKIESS